MEPQSLATRAIRGVFWTGSASLVQLFIPLLLYGYLPIEEMGRFEGALTIVMLMALVGSLGLGEALVQFRTADETHFSSAFWTNLVFGTAITVLIIAIAPAVAHLLSRQNPDQFRQVLILLSLLIPSASVSGIFRARLQRDLRFRPMALAEILSVLAYAVVVLTLLPFYGILSPVIGAIVREFALLVGLAAAAAWRPRFCFSLPALRQILSFGLNFTGSRGVNFLNSHLATFFIMPLLGETAHGYYKFAYRLTLLPLTRLSTTITRVSFPTFSTLQEDDDLLSRGYLKSVQSIALFAWPACTGLFVFAPEVLRLVQQLNAQEMMPALVPLRLLVLATQLKAVGIVVGSVFMARGRANWSFYWSLFSLAILIPALYLGTGYGVEGVAAVIALTALLFLVLSQHLANRLTGLGFAAYLGALVRPVAVTLSVLLVLAASRFFISGPAIVALATALFAGLLAYLLALRLFAWNLCREYWKNFRGVRLEADGAKPETPG